MARLNSIQIFIAEYITSGKKDFEYKDYFNKMDGIAVIIFQTGIINSMATRLSFSFPKGRGESLWNSQEIYWVYTIIFDSAFSTRLDLYACLVLLRLLNNFCSQESHTNWLWKQNKFVTLAARFCRLFPGSHYSLLCTWSILMQRAPFPWAKTTCRPCGCEPQGILQQWLGSLWLAHQWR